MIKMPRTLNLPQGPLDHVYHNDSEIGRAHV